MKPKPKTAKPRAALKTTTTVLPTVTSATPVGAGVSNVFQRKPDGSSNVGSLLIVLALSLAIACLSIAVVPATLVKWLLAAIFVSERQLDLTVVGLALLVVTAFAFFLA